MGIEIRIAVPEDAHAACGVLRRSILECCEQDHQHQPEILDAWLGNKTPETVAGWFASPSYFSLVAERDDGTIVGMALVTQAGKLALCYVLPEVLYSGVGKGLLAGVEAQARTWGVSKLRLHSTATALGFYERHGYLNAGKEKSSYGVECDLLWKSLSAGPTAPGNPRKLFCNCGTE